MALVAPATVSEKHVNGQERSIGELKSNPRQPPGTPQGGSGQCSNKLPAGQLRSAKSNGSTSTAISYQPHPWRDLVSPFASEYRRMHPATRHMMASLTVAPVASCMRRSARAATSNTGGSSKNKCGRAEPKEQTGKEIKGRGGHGDRLDTSAPPIWAPWDVCTDQMCIVRSRPNGTAHTRMHTEHETRASIGWKRSGKDSYALQKTNDPRPRKQTQVLHTPANSPCNHRNYEARKNEKHADREGVPQTAFSAGFTTCHPTTTRETPRPWTKKNKRPSPTRLPPPSNK